MVCRKLLTAYLSLVAKTVEQSRPCSDQDSSPANWTHSQTRSPLPSQTDIFPSSKLPQILYTCLALVEASHHISSQHCLQSVNPLSAPHPPTLPTLAQVYDGRSSHHQSFVSKWPTWCHEHKQIPALLIQLLKMKRMVEINHSVPVAAPKLVT